MSYGLTQETFEPNGSIDGLVIAKYVAGMIGGININDDYKGLTITKGDCTKIEVPVASPVYLEDGEYKILDVKADGKTFEELPSDVEVVGVTKSTMFKSEVTASVLQIGVVNTKVMEVKYSTTLLAALSDKLKIVFEK